MKGRTVGRISRSDLLDQAVAVRKRIKFNSGALKDREPEVAKPVFRLIKLDIPRSFDFSLAFTCYDDRQITNAVLPAHAAAEDRIVLSKRLEPSYSLVALSFSSR